MDTRTAREGLNQLAQEAGRLGKSSQEDVLGFVKAADKINVALDDLGEGATLTLSKLTGVFGTEAVYGTEQSLLKVGSVINELSQNSAASAPYLAEFASRLGGVGSQAGMTVQQIMAYGAVLDANQQQLESSATALSQLIVKLYRDPAKYAEAAGLDVQKFTDLLKKDANEAVLTLLDTLNKAGGMDALAPMFADMGEKGARSVTTLSMLASKISDVREQQKAANQAFEEGTSIDKEFEVQNNTVMAGLDKAKNSFHEMAVELGEKLAPIAKSLITGTSAAMKVLSATITFINNNKTAIVSLTAAIAAYTVATNLAAIKTGILTAAQKVATAATKLFNLALSASPAGLVAAAVTGLATALVMMRQKADEASEAQKALNSIQEDAQAKAVEQRFEIENLIAAAGDFTLGLDNQRRALSKLNNMIPGFNGKIDSQAKKFTYAKGALDDYLDSLIRLYEIEGAKKLLMEIGERKARIAADNAVIVEETKDIIKQGQSGVRSSDNAGKYLVNNIKYEENNKELKKLDAQEQAVKKKYGKDIVKNTVSPKQPKSPQADGGITGGHGGHGGHSSGGHSGGRKNKRKHRSNGGHTGGSKKNRKHRSSGSHGGSGGSGKASDKFKAEKEWRKKEEDTARIAYAKGEMTEEEYKDKLSEIAQEYSQKVMNKPNATEAEKLDAEASYYEEVLKASDTTDQDNAWKKEQEDNAKISWAVGNMSDSEYNMRLSEIAQEYYKRQMNNPGGSAAKKLEAEANYYDEIKKYIELIDSDDLEKFEKEYSVAVGKLMQDYIDGSIGLETYNKTLEAMEVEHLRQTVEKHKEGTKERLAAEEEYQKKLFEMEQERQEKMKEDYQKYYEQNKKMKELKEEYFGLSEEDKATAYNNAVAVLDQIYATELKKLGDNLKAKLELERKYDKAKKKIYDGIYNADVESSKENTKNWMQWTEAALDKMFGKGTWETYGAFIQSTYSSLMSTYQNTVKLIEAGEQEKLAAMTKKYDAEIKAAEGNQYRINQIEKKKAAEEKRIKDAANQRAMAMELAQALSGTALAAINAYASASKDAFWLGPIAAAAAVAAGMIQVAAIKKQHDAQSEGYSEGGFTKPGAKNEPAGIVHAGEWVASQRLLASPVARPMIDVLDHAQRTNTIGRLGGAMAAAAPVVVTESEDLRSVIKQLTERLNEPFVTINTVTGPHGMEQAQNDYKKLMNNTLPKNKRK